MSDSRPLTDTSVALPDPKSWPKNPSGTVDWETVFEHAETGFLTIVARAETPVVLRETSLAIIRQLFSRKGDEDETARLVAELNDIVSEDLPPAQLKVVADAIVRTLRGIKEFRQKKAAEYEKEKAEKAAQEAADAKSGKAPAAKQPTDSERRKASQAQASIKKALEQKKKQRTLMLSALAVAAIAGAVGGYFYFRTPPLPTRADLILLEQMKSAATGNAAKTHVYGGVLQARRYLGTISVIADNIPVEACVTLGLNLANKGTLSINGELLAFAALKDAQTLCGRATAPIRATWEPPQ